MHEPQNSTSLSKRNRQSAGLLVTKFCIPSIRPGLLPRSHLIERLEEATTRELVLVSTPPGFGKTTLLAGWARSTERPVAWLSLGRGDNDPARFWRYIIAAVERVRQGVGGQARSLLNASPQPNTRAVVTALVNELAAHSDELVLILDDYHLIESPSIHDSLAFLLEHLLPGLHLVISSRSDPPIPLARFRARVQQAALHGVLAKIRDLGLPLVSVVRVDPGTARHSTKGELRRNNMRKIFLHFAITLDGMVSNVEQWVSFTDEAMKDTSAYHDNFDAIIFGNNNYAPLAAYWQHAETSSTSKAERAFAKKVNDMSKFVLSHGEVELVWKNSALLRAKDSEAFKQAIERLKTMPGKNITVDSGEGTWRSFLEHDLWDGIDMLVHPLVIGRGKPLFVSMPTKAPLRLVENKTYDNGVVNLRYEK